MRNIISCMCLLFITCASTDIYLNKDGLKGKVSKILIVDFEKRYMKFDPFIAGNLKDALQFELSKLGYEVKFSSFEKTAEENEVKINQPLEYNIKESIKKFPSDLVIHGIISEKEYGDAIDTTTSTCIVLHLYNRQGEKVGEARYLSSDTLENAKNIKKISIKLAEYIHKEI